MLHGNSLSGECFRHQLDSRLGQEYRLIAPDLPGCGNSTPFKEPEGANTPAGLASLLSGFCGAMEIKDAVFVGWSFGGHILLEASKQLPARGYFIFGAPPLAGLQDFDTAFLPQRCIELIWKPEHTAEDLDVILDILISLGTAQDRELLRNDLMRSDGRSRAAMFTSSVQGWYMDERKAAETLGVPIAIAHGKYDRLVSLDHITSLSIPTLWRGGVQIIEDAAHAPHMEQPEQFNSILGEFLNEIWTG